MSEDLQKTLTVQRGSASVPAAVRGEQAGLGASSAYYRSVAGVEHLASATLKATSEEKEESHFTKRSKLHELHLQRKGIKEG